MMTASSVFRQIVTPPLIFLRRRPTLEPTGAPVQDRGRLAARTLPGAPPGPKAIIMANSGLPAP